MKSAQKKLLKLVSQLSIKKGFTLIELLVVIAVLGVLAAIVLLAVNPAEQLARARDASRISAVTEVGNALQGYYTANSATYPAVGTTWMSTLVTSSDIKTVPTNPTYTITTNGSPCNSTSTLGQNGYCYNTGGSDTVVYARLESTLYNGKCTSAGQGAWWVFSAAQARAGGLCASTTADPTSVSSFSW